MTTLIADSSCIIDLHKVDLLKATLELPFDLAIPRDLQQDELLDFGSSDITELLNRGLQILDLGDLGYEQAGRYALAFDQLSWHDCIVLRMAEELEGSILLSGDSTLRRIAMNKSIEVHGVI